MNVQCSCKPRITGKKCDQIEENYFIPSLDFQIYEAEYAIKLKENFRSSENSINTWNGNGFMRVFDNDHIKFHLKNIISSGSYDIVMRFDTKSLWHDISVKIVNKGLDYNAHKEKPKKMIQTKNCSYFNKGQYPIEYNNVFIGKSI